MVFYRRYAAEKGEVMARRRLSVAVVTLIVIDVILLLVLVALLLTRPSEAGALKEARAASAPTATARSGPEPVAAAQRELVPQPTQSPAQPPGHIVEVPADARSEPMFASPSRNIWCEMDPRGVTCTIGGFEYTPPDSPDCPGQVGRVLQLTEDEALMPCVTEDPDTSAPESFPELDYGQASKHGDFLCTSEETGITCQSLVTGRGFTLAYREAELF